MMIISFAWTTPAFVARQKTCTRRDWNDRYAKQFVPGRLAQAWSQQPRYRGRRIGTIELLSLTQERYCDAPGSDWKAEGFDYLQTLGATVHGCEPLDLWNEWAERRDTCWVVRFEIVGICEAVI